MKEVKVVYGPRHNRQSGIVRLSGVADDDPLTPKLARAALMAVSATTGEVWELAQYGDAGDLMYGDVYGYRVYPRSARKVAADV